MYAVIRDNQYDPKKLPQSAKEMSEFNAHHATQPGYDGNIVVDLSNGHMLIVTLWRTEKQAHAARIALEPDIQRLLVPLMTRPSQLVGAGPVVVADLANRAGATGQ
jgi:hypothetical protein